MDPVEASKNRHPSSQDAVIWYAQLTNSMLAGLTPDTKQELLDALDDAVAAICEDYGV
jgi:hypothetical protein